MPPKRQLLAGVVVTVIAILAALWIGTRPPSPPATGRGELLSVAVLPLTNISDDPEESDYLAEGIGQAVASKLTQVGFRVTPWDTARRYRDREKPPQGVARELNVDAVLTGTFQVSTDQIMISVALQEASSDFPSWTQDIVEPFEDVFQVQLSLATAVAASLDKELTGKEAALLGEPPSANADAYDLYLQGAYLMQEGTEEATSVALQYFTRAVELDPELVEAHVGLGAVRTARFNGGWEGGLSNLEQAERSFETALRFDPADPRARRGLVHIEMYRGRSEACLTQGREAARFGDADDLETLLVRAAAYARCGLVDLSIPLLRRVIEIDPMNQPAHWLLAGAPEVPQPIIEAGEEYFRRFGDDGSIHAFVALAHHRLGSLERAREHYEKATTSLRRDGSPLGFPQGIAQIYGGLLFAQMGARADAEALWSDAAARMESRLQATPDHVGLRLYLAIFRGLLGDHAAFAREEARAMESNFNAVELYFLAATHAYLGEPERAAEVLTRMLRLGRVDSFWKLPLDVASPGTAETEVFRSFVEEYEAEVQRLRKAYGPRS